ncbi:MAG: nucleotide-binding protein [Anaeromyxobacter sp.]
MRRLLTVLAAVLAVAGCKKSEGPVVAAPITAPQEAGQPPAGLQGRILERIDAPPYSYLRLETAAGERWAAVQQTRLDKGATVAVGGGLEMKNYTSQTLKRTFESVYFGQVMEGGDATAGAMPPGHPDISGKPRPATPPGGGMGGAMGGGMDMASQHAQAAAGPADVGDVKVAKASGADGRTVAEIHAQRAALKEKKVVLQGKVVKANDGIMGRNWLHLRDGSGTADKKDNDITVTTADSAAVGDVVTVTGTVRVDKDFGMGYQYPVIIEDAKVGK